MSSAGIPTPCQGICRLGADRTCDGCGRSAAEIARWLAYSAAQRQVILDRVAAWRIRSPAAALPESGTERRAPIRRGDAPPP